MSYENIEIQIISKLIRYDFIVVTFWLLIMHSQSGNTNDKATIDIWILILAILERIMAEWGIIQRVFCVGLAHNIRAKRKDIYDVLYCMFMNCKHVLLQNHIWYNNFAINKKNKINIK